jgi:hypothetical protein
MKGEVSPQEAANAYNHIQHHPSSQKGAPLSQGNTNRLPAEYATIDMDAHFYAQVGEEDGDTTHPCTAETTAHIYAVPENGLSFEEQFPSEAIVSADQPAHVYALLGNDPSLDGLPLSETDMPPFPHEYAVLENGPSQPQVNNKKKRSEGKKGSDDTPLESGAVYSVVKDVMQAYR